MLLDKMRVKEQLKLIIQDTYLYDYGIRKVGYDSEFGYDPTGSLWKSIFEELGLEVPEEELKEYNTFILDEFPFFTRVPPSRFLVDPDTDGPGLETARWCGEEFYRPLADVLDDDRYNIPKDLRASHILSYAGDKVVISPKEWGIESGKKPKDHERIKLIEVWDKKEKRMFVLVDGFDGYAREEDDVLKLDNFFPYDKLCFNPVSDEHYSTSDAMYVEKQQVEFNDIRTQEMAHRRKENIKILYKKGVFTETQLNQLKSGEVGPLVECIAQGALGDSIYVVAPNMSRDIFMAANDIRGDFREILAFGQNQMGQELGRRKTASEAMIINQFVQVRSDERRDTIAMFLERSIADINSIVFELWDTPDIIQIIGPNGVAWEEWTGEKLRGKYAVRLLMNSTLPMNKTLYRGEVKELLQMLGQDPNINQRELRRILLDSYEEFDTSRLLLPSPNYDQPLIDFRPGKGQRNEEGGESRVGIPGTPESANAGREQQVGGGGNGGRTQEVS